MTDGAENWRRAVHEMNVSIGANNDGGPSIGQAVSRLFTPVWQPNAGQANNARCPGKALQPARQMDVCRQSQKQRIKDFVCYQHQARFPFHFLAAFFTSRNNTRRARNRNRHTSASARTRGFAAV